MGQRIVVTGGCGFIGHHVVEHLLKHTDWEILVVDKLTYAAAGFDRLRDIAAFDDRRVRVFATDLAAGISPGVEQELGRVHAIVHLAAETHVDASIADPGRFVRANVWGTFQLLEYARRCDGLEWLVYGSTDEVFGPAPAGTAYREWDRYNCTNPYAATKAAGEELALAWAHTYGLPVLVTHTMNAFGERQHPEKFIPKVVRAVRAGVPVPIHADPTRTRSGSRHWIHCRNIAAALLFLLTQREAMVRDKINIVGEREVSNLDLALHIARLIGRPLHYELVDFHSSRPGHDLRYALNGDRMAELGWRIPVPFEESLERTLRWMLDPQNARWLALPGAQG